MARLNNAIDNDSDEELPELEEILHGKSRASPNKGSRKAAKTSECCHDEMPESGIFSIGSTNSAPKTIVNDLMREKITKVKHFHKDVDVDRADSLHPPLSTASFTSAKDFYHDDDCGKRAQQVRSSPRRAASKIVNYSLFLARRSDESLSAIEDDDSFTDLSGFIVPDSASEDEEKPWRPSRKETRKTVKNFDYHGQTSQQDPSRSRRKHGEPIEHFEIDLASSAKTSSDPERPDSPVEAALPAKAQIQATEISDLDEPFSQLRFSPPRSQRPLKTTAFDNIKTPPSSPSKSRLQSPSKKHRIPPSPHRPSIDAFWSQNVINDWNDEYSPKKSCRVPGPAELLTLSEHEEENEVSPVSPRKSPTKSPAKKDKQAAKTFNLEKTSLATAFLAEVDNKVANGQVSHLTASTGGITIIWSKKLSSTAGRANWRREAIRHKKPADSNSNNNTSYSSSPPDEYRHHATIELAEKVIDTPDRLINVLAHEYCHLANFMLSGIKTHPHGKEFKSWAAKVTAKFAYRGVEVTTKHGYEISYKYVWNCDGCGVEYKRHSKSVDPGRHRCGGCKGRLRQVLPVPRKESEYARFVKEGWDRVKSGTGEGKGMGEINALLAKEWEVRKGTWREGEGVGKESCEVVEGADDDAGGDSRRREESLEVDEVVRKLDFLGLGSGG